MSRFDEVEAFIAVARTGSVSRAARQLLTAKSAISRRLAALETRLGAPLVTRTTRRLSLTDAGAAFLPRAEAALDDLNTAESDVRGAAGALVGKLRVAAPLSFGLAYLHPIVSAFVHAHPEVDMEIDFSDRRVDLIEEGFDLALRIGNLADSSLVARRLAPIRHTLAAAPAFWDRHGRPRAPGDLEGLDCVRYLYSARPRIIAYTAPDGSAGRITPRVRFLSSNGDFIARLAADGCGFAIEPHFILAPAIASGALEPALPDVGWASMSLYIVSPPTRRATARARAFADAVATAVKDAPDL